MNAVETYWKNFICGNPQYKNREYSAWHFCDNKKSANKLADLVKDGIKKGTASLEKNYSFETEPLPEKGDISVIINWEQEPQCIIETVKILKYKFKDVPAEFAEIEGEGDKSLTYWKKVHLDFFTREAKEYGFEFNEELYVICEEFKIVFI